MCDKLDQDLVMRQRLNARYTRPTLEWASPSRHSDAADIDHPLVW
jgi:hypothetical protein